MHVSHYLSKIISYVIGLDLEFHSHSREKVQCFETRLRIIFLTLTWRDEIEIIIWSFLYFETRTRLHIVILMFRDEIETLENHFLWPSDKKWTLLLSRIPADLWREFWFLSILGMNESLWFLFPNYEMECFIPFLFPNFGNEVFHSLSVPELRE